MFEHIKAAPADPILGLGEAFKAETRSNKINLGIGVYKDDKGDTPIMAAVKQAEQRLFDIEMTKNYLSIDGVANSMPAQKNCYSVSIRKSLNKTVPEPYKV